MMNVNIWVLIATLKSTKKESRVWSSSVDMEYVDNNGDMQTMQARYRGTTKHESIVGLMKLVQIKTKRLMVKLNKHKMAVSEEVEQMQAFEEHVRKEA